MTTYRPKSTQDQQPTARAKPAWAASGEFATEAEYQAEVLRLAAELRAENVRIRQLRQEGWL